MMRRWRSLLVVVMVMGVLAPLGPPDVANAGHEDLGTSVHEPPPTPPGPLHEGWSAACLISYGWGWGIPSVADEGIETAFDAAFGAAEDVQEIATGHNHAVGGAEFAECWNLPTGADVQELSPHMQGELGTHVLRPFPSEYFLFFASGTDGPPPCDAADAVVDCGEHGAWSAAGWSHSSCYDDDAPKGDGDCTFERTESWPYVGPNLYSGTGDPQEDGCVNCGEIVLDPNTFIFHGGPTDFDSPKNWMKFCRGVYDLDGDGLPDCSNGVQTSTGGDHVVAWGALDGWDGQENPPLCFVADLALARWGLDDGGQSGQGFAFNGVAHFWYAEDTYTDSDCDAEAPA